MTVTDIGWTRDRVEHIKNHKIATWEVEQAAFDDPNRIIKKVAAADSFPGKYVYRLLGRTEEGRYLAFFFIYKGRGSAYLITARDMDNAERRQYNARRR